MKKLIAYLLTACALAAQVPNVNVQKSPSTNALTNSFIVGSGTSVTPNGTGIIIATNVSGNVSWNQITNTPNSAAGYGIVNGATIDQLGASPQTGTGAIVFSNNATLNSATMVTPNLGTPSYVSLNNGSNLPTTALTGKITNSQLTNNSITVTAGTGLSGGGNVQLGGTITLTNNYNGTVTQVGGTGNVNGITLTGNVTTTGNLTLGGTLGNITNSQLTNNSINVIAGNGLSGGGNTQLGSSVTLSNAGVTNISTGTGISANASTGSITLSNTGVTSIVAGTNVTINSATGSVQINSSNPGGTVTSVSTNNQNGVITSVATATSTPNITIGLGNITPLSDTSVFNGPIGQTTPNAGAFNSLKTTALTGYLYGNGASNVSAATTIPTTALSGTIPATSVTGLATVATTGNYYDLTNKPTLNAGTVTSVAGTGTVQGITLTGNVTSSGSLTLGGSLSPINLGTQVTGTLNTSSGGTGVTTSSGANSVVLRDSNSNVSANNFYSGFSSQAASGTTIVLTALSAPNYAISGSGGQVIKLPDATTLPNGTLFSFNNNQSSGAITVQNNSSTTICTTQSGAFIEVVLLSNGSAAGTWDYHNVAPSNASWSTNTLSWAGSYTNGTWNGNAVGALYGGTGTTGLTGYVYGNGTSAMTASTTIPTSALSGTIALGTQVSGTLNAASGGTGAHTASTTIPTSVLSGTISNGQLTNNSITIAGTATALGGSISQDTITGLSTTGLVQRTGANTLAIATPNTNYLPATTGNSAQLLASNGSGGMANVNVGSGLSYSGGTLSSTSGGGSVTNVTVSGNSGVLAGVATPTTTPAISIGLGNITPLSDTSVFNGPIGGITPNAGSFTTLNSSGVTKLATGSGYTSIGTGGGMVGIGGTPSNGYGLEVTGQYPGYATLVKYAGDVISTWNNGTQDMFSIRTNGNGSTVLDGLNGTYLNFGSSSGGAGSVQGDLLIAPSHVVYVNNTTSSSSTSTGALVVGNGTSGGLGVGGNANIGGNVAVGGATPQSWALGNAIDFSGGATWSPNYQNFGSIQGLYYNGSNYIYKYTSVPSSYMQQSAGSFNFQTAPNGTAGGTATLTSALYITNAGNVGIGTTSPSYVLDVNGSARFNSQIGIGGASPNSVFSINSYIGTGKTTLQFQAGTANLWQFGTNAGAGTSDDITAIYSGTYGPSHGYNPLMLWNSAGSVSIPVTTSSSTTTSGALQVAGGVGIQGALYAGGLSVTNTGFLSTGVYSGYGSVYGSGMDFSSPTTRFLSNANGSYGNFYWYSGNNGVFASPMNLSGSGNLNLYTNSVNGFTVTQQTAGGYGLYVNAINNGGTYYIGQWLNAGTQVGAILSNGSTTSYVTTSDKRLKTSLRPWSLGDKFDDIPIGEFNWLKDGSVSHGTLAQEMYKVYPDAVHIGGDVTKDPWSVDYGKLTVPLIAEVKSLRSRVKTLEQEQADTQKQLNDLTAKFNQYISTHP